ncbi:YdeI/OmpD-associated family protein [Nocardiopsis composta]
MVEGERGQGRGADRRRPDARARPGRGAPGPGGRPLGRGLRTAEDRGGAPDLAAALDADPAARKAFEELDKTGRYQVALPLLQALTPETRRARLDRAVRRLADGEKPG